MYKICVFGGTTEGRELVEFLNAQPCEVTACVATEYGQALLPEAERLTVSARRLPADEIKALLTDRHFDLVIDATHPYAASITKSIARACAETGVERWRLLRGASDAPEDAVFVESTEKAIEFLDQTEGNILLTTGSKELKAYSQIKDFAERVYARVLPLEDSLVLCREAGVKAAHILAMQGPFSEEMNTAMLRAIGAKWLVTKDGGAAGGFAEKAAAAAKTGVRLLVIGRPAEADGIGLSETVARLCARFSFGRVPHVCVVGIGPGSEAAQTGEVRAAIEHTDCLIGAARMLEVAARPGQLRVAAIAPDAIAAAIAAHPECSNFTVLMSGDTGFFSGTKKLLPLLPNCHVRVLPGLSSMSYLCARLVDAGLGAVRVSVGERLSYPDEKITCGTAAELASREFDKLSVALIENPAPDAVVTHGLPDEVFLREMDPAHVVPMTKSEVRAVCLSKLALTERAVCWDVGAGTGSVSIEMALQAKRGRVYAVERQEDALALLARNKAAFSAGNLEIVSGTAPAACEALPAPTHVFLGGTAGNLNGILDAALRKNPHVRIVATAVTLESVGALAARMADFEKAECVSLQAARARTAGSYHLMQGQNPVYIFTMQNRREQA